MEVWEPQAAQKVTLRTSFGRFGDLQELSTQLLAGWMASGWLTGDLAGWLGDPRLSDHAQGVVNWDILGAIATSQIGACCKIRSSKDEKLQAYRTYMAYRAYMLQTTRLTVLQGYLL